MKKVTHGKKALLLAKQAQGTMAKVAAMIEDGEYCPAIIQQADSVGGLIKSLKKELLAGHLDGCLAMKLKENKEQTVKELLKIYNLSV
ncbi:MAG: metal-sensitive transcriptional regulator [Patescibacteria group bacterium]|nr:MAG: metal-sensitive transcriptional regulator [Patescibacteria group bacterium]